MTFAARMLQSLKSKINYEIELVSQLLLTTAVAFVYGCIECKYIPTGSANFKPLPGVFSMWSYYHLWMILLLSISSFSLAIGHIQWMLKGRGYYVLFICAANAVASLMLEDIGWFLAAGRGIRYDEWTMIHPGWGVNFYFTYVPFWYFGATAVCITLYAFASHFATIGYRSYRANF